MTRDLWLLFVANTFVVLSSVYFAIFKFSKLQLSEETRRRNRTVISNAFFREFWYFLIDPLKLKLIKWDVNPNTITFVGMLFSVLGGLAFGLGEFGLGSWMIICSGTCDVFDGQLARAKKISLKSGAFFDSTLDRVAEAAIFGGFLWFFRNDSVFFMFSLFAAMSSQIISYCRARAEGLGFNSGSERGLFQRAERFIILAVGTALSPLFDVYFEPFLLAKITIAVIGLGTLQTAFSRCVGLYYEIKAFEKNSAR